MFWRSLSGKGVLVGFFVLSFFLFGTTITYAVTGTTADTSDAPIEAEGGVAWPVPATVSDTVDPNTGTGGAAGEGSGGGSDESPPLSIADMETVEGKLYFMVVNFFGWLVWVGGYILDAGINEFVIGFAGNFLSDGVGQAVDILWVAVRDFFNILFIFGIVWIGFKMILNSDDSSTRSALVYLIIAALLVNFSLFITKFVVDFSNILAYQIAVNGLPTETFTGGAGSDPSTKVVLASNFFNHMGLAESLNINEQIADGTALPWAYIFGSALMYAIAAFVFAAGGIMLLIRFVVLSVYMLMSPFLFIGLVFPSLMSATISHWKKFLQKAFFAPVYILMIFFAATVLDFAFNTSTGSAQGGGFFNSSDQIGNVNGTGVEMFVTFLLPFLLTSAFLIAAVRVGDVMSVNGASTAVQLGRNITKSGRRFATRNTVGWGAAGLSYAGARASKGVDRLDELSRRNTGARVARGLINTATLGATSHTSLKGITNAASKSSIAGSRTYDQYTKDERERKNTRDRITSRRDDDAAIKDAEELINTYGINPNSPALNETQREIFDKAERAANRYSTSEIEKMSEEDRNKLAKYFKTNTVSKLLDSDNLSSKEKESLNKEYEKIIATKTEANGQAITEQMQKLSIKQLEILGDTFVQDNLEYFSEEQMENIGKSDNFTERQKDSYKKVRAETFKNYAGTTGTPKSTNDFQSMFKLVNGKDAAGNKTFESSGGIDKTKKPKEIARLPAAALKDPRAASFINASVLEEIVSKKTQSVADRRAIAANLVTTGPGGTVINKPGVVIAPDVLDYLNSSAGQRNYF